MKGRLLVLPADRISDWMDKGEVIDRYYNPGNRFAHVDIVLTHRDEPDPEGVQRLVGDASVTVWNVPAPDRLLYWTLGARPSLVTVWARKVSDLAERLRPDLVRCYGASVNAVAATRIAREQGIPSVLSLHTNHRENRRMALRRLPATAKEALVLTTWSRLETVAIRRADCVICVYRYQVPWVRDSGAQRIEVIPNAVGSDAVRVKDDYGLGSPPRMVVPGRQIPGKDPAPVLTALAQIPDVRCDLIGDGDLHEGLQQLASALGIADRCRFVRRMPNAELLASLRDYDIAVSVNDHGGVSKVELECALTGMPVITNPHPLEDRPEILEGDCVVAGPAAGSYAQAIRTLLEDGDLRARLGRSLRLRAAETVDPRSTENRVVALYDELLEQGGSPGARS